MTVDIRQMADAVAEELDADIFLLNGTISNKLERKVCDSVFGRKNRRERIVVIVATEGGSADAAFRIGRHFQEGYDELVAVVAGWCKSAGTLICIAANQLIIGRSGELGPLDVQFPKSDDLAALASVLTLDSAFRSLRTVSFEIFENFLVELISKSGGRITTRTAAELSVQLTVGLMSPIFQQIDPLKLGEDYRATRISEDYAQRLNLRARNLKSDPSLDALDALVRGYPSHRFVIDRREAEDLFQRVDPLSGLLEALVDALGTVAREPMSTAKGRSEIAEYVNGERRHEIQSEADGLVQDRESSGGDGEAEIGVRAVSGNSKKSRRNIPISKNGAGSKKRQTSSSK